MCLSDLQRVNLGKRVAISFSHEQHIFVCGACLCARVLHDLLRMNTWPIIDTLKCRCCELFSAVLAFIAIAVLAKGGNKTKED